MLTKIKNMTVEQCEELLPQAVEWATDFGHRKNGLWLCTKANLKLKKGEKEGWLSTGLELASGKRAGHTVCQYAVNNRLECLKWCIVTAGNGRFKAVYQSRIRRTRMLFDNPELFMSLLWNDLKKSMLKAHAQGMSLAVRLNVFSDLHWTELAPWLFEALPTVQFYDYTKEASHVFHNVKNYHITLSHHEKMSIDEVKQITDAGRTVAVVFADKRLPETWHGIPVISGDDHDLRFIDPDGVIVGLKAKGKASQTNKEAKALKKSEFIIQLDQLSV